MLKEVSIQNFAIIDELEVLFQPGLNIITGETGAGKSILLGALGLVFGERADMNVLRNKEKKCVVEVLFDATTETQKWLEAQDIDQGHDITLRREINSNGKSRTFINDTPATLQQLKQLAALLVDLHQQFDTLELGEAYFQREILDAMAGCSKEALAYNELYTQYLKEQRELQEMMEQQLSAQKEKDYHRFLLDELEQASFKENELEAADQELKMLNNAGAISSALQEAVTVLRENETPVVQQIKYLLQRLQPYRQLNKQLEETMERLHTVHIELGDIANELDHLQNSVTIDEERMQQLNERIELGYKLQKKHGVHTTAELLEFQEQLQNKLQDVMNLEESIAAKQQIVTAYKNQLQKAAAYLSAQRTKEAIPFAEKVNSLLVKVGMPNARLKAEVKAAALNAYGTDEILFLFDANKSNRFEPINKVASGGELSRLMLCIKSLVAQQMALPTMLFDEIDTGISGEAARQVGLLLKELSTKHQVITITHLPQIAAKATAHYHVFKQEEGTSIVTRIRLLKKEEQIETIARMLSGEQLTPSSLKTAKELVTG
ncbi:MAG TPA: DNA repair protein RecN [Lacibacter sp.]|nr:DNA repair protein RecN [Lacibacter sp.]